MPLQLLFADDAILSTEIKSVPTILLTLNGVFCASVFNPNQQEKMKTIDINIGSINLECGKELPNVTVRCTIIGNLERNASRVVWICHGLTANSNPSEWWPEAIGTGKLFDPEHVVVVSTNVLGSCYGTTGPQSVNPATGKPYLLDFPLITIRDMVKANQAVKQSLGIGQLYMLVGASLGGFQALEWELMYPGTVRFLVPIATSVKASPWVIAFNQSQRLALLADPTFDGVNPQGGQRGLVAARSIALLSYRGNRSYDLTQVDNRDLLSGFRAETYQTYQGEKLVMRFDAYSYLTLSRGIDSQNVGRGRGDIAQVMAQIKAPTLSIGIESDILFPTHEQKQIAALVPNATYAELQSDFGHDGFLLEYKQLEDIIVHFLNHHNEKLNGNLNSYPKPEKC